MCTGIIFDLQRYSIHDGPGIRTTVFLKGCLLRCPWCSNPESQSFSTEEMGQRTVGTAVSADEVMKKALRDKVFFTRSGGGITLSGGEPLAQPEFARKIVEKCRDANINVCIETSGYASWEVAEPILTACDFVLYDVKMIDADRHRQLTGVDNKLILENLKRLAGKRQDIQVRVPVIPGINFDQASLCAIADYCREIGVQSIQCLPYHRLGMHKYEELGREYLLKKALPPGLGELIAEAKLVAKKCGVNITV